MCQVAWRAADISMYIFFGFTFQLRDWKLLHFNGICRKPKANIFKSRDVAEETEQLWKSKSVSHLHRLGQDLNNQKYLSASFNSSDILKHTVHLLPNILLLGMLKPP